jgi:hypothetical protein
MVCAVDGALHNAVTGISADVGAAKMLWIGDWIFMFSGTLSSASLFRENLDLARMDNPDLLSRRHIQKTVWDAYKKRQSQWSAGRFLAPYNMDMEEFKKNGMSIFGNERFGEISRAIEQDAANNFREDFLVVGWGKTEAAAMVYGVHPDGPGSYDLDGFAAIGSGALTAISVLMSLEVGRDSCNEDVIYAVAAAKFAAESCDGVGKKTTIWVSHKRTEKDKENRPVGEFVDEADVDLLRKLWEAHGKPRIPPEIYSELSQIASRVNAASPGGVVRSIKRALSGQPS